MPEPWKKNSINVLHKSGSIQDAGNYRPICILDITYKILARVIYNRIIKKINDYQSVDQAGFMKCFSTDDHLLSSTLLIEKAWKNNRPLWICAVDFKKAFDSITWDSIWMALKESKVDDGYISVLQSLYSNQTGTVKFGVESDEFRIERGTKQGDPVSTALFNAVLELCMRRTKKRWRACGVKSTHCGFLVKNQEEVRGELDPTKNSQFLTNLRFADDLLIIAKTKEELSNMMTVLKEECQKVGLEMHNVKTQALTNGLQEHCDLRKLVLKQFDDKTKEDKQTKEEKKQTKLEKQKSKNKKTPIRAGARNPIPTTPKRKIGGKKTTKKREKAKARTKIKKSEVTIIKKATTTKNTKSQQAPKKKKEDEEDSKMAPPYRS